MEKPLQEALHLVMEAQRIVLQVAREEKPSGSWPEWATEIDNDLDSARRKIIPRARKEGS